MATIKEIAELAGVSRGTVDRVLNNRGAVNADTREKILEIAKLLDYQPNKAGIALAAQKKHFKIGVLLFSKENPFFDDIFEGLYEKLEELSVYGCSITKRQIPFDLNMQLTAIDDFLQEGIHGLILSPYDDISVAEKINALSDMGIPCITVNTDLPDSARIAYVGSDYKKCGQTAAGLLRLLTNGTAKVGIVTGSDHILCHKERVSSFIEYIHVHAPQIEIADIKENHDDDKKSYEAVSLLLQQHPDINAFYFTAAGVCGGCRAIIDADLPHLPKVITFDDVPKTKELLRNGIISATICQQPKRQGSLSLALLVEYLLTKELPKTQLHYTDLPIKIRENL